MGKIHHFSNPLAPPFLEAKHDKLTTEGTSSNFASNFKGT